MLDANGRNRNCTNYASLKQLRLYVSSTYGACNESAAVRAIRTYFVWLCPAVGVLLLQNGLDVANGEDEVGLTEHSQSWDHPATQPLEEGIRAVKVQKWNILLLMCIKQRSTHQAMHVLLILLL